MSDILNFKAAFPRILVAIICALFFNVAFGQPNGLYLSTGSKEDIKVMAVDGSETRETTVNLNSSLPISKAFVYSQNNGNKNFRVELVYGGTPTNDHRLVLLVNGKYYKAWNSGMKRNDQNVYVNYGSFGVNKDQAEEIAKALKVPCNYRKHFGHILKYEFIPSKSTYRLGDSVWVKLKITNAGSVPVYFNKVKLCGNDSRSDYFDFDVYFNGESSDNDKNTKCYENWDYVELKPGETDFVVECVNRWGLFPKRGKYKIDCSYNLYLRSELAQKGYPNDQDSKHKAWDEAAKQTIEIVVAN